MSLTLLGSTIEDIANQFIASTLGIVLWGLSDVFFVIINLCESLFRRFAGLETLTMDGDKVEGDIVLYLLQTNIVQDVFFSIVILSFFLLIIFTTFAIVKNQYSEKPKPVMNIINNSVKGLLQYLMVPVCVVVGLAVGNVILQAVDGATRTQTEGEGGASSMLFVAAVYNANQIRTGDLDKRRDDLEHLLYWGRLDNIEDEVARILGHSANDDLYTYAKYATEDQINEIANLIDASFSTGKLTGTSIYTAGSVAMYYDMLSISYITIWVGGAFLVYCLIMITWGLLGRIFKMVLSYCITPALISMYPMDEGKALKSWIGYFSKEATMAYASVGIVNIFYSVLPVVKSIDIYGGGQWNPVNSIIQLLITISGYMLVKSLIGTVSGWIGTGDAFAEGKATMGEVTKPLKSGVSKTVGAFAGFKGGWKQAGDIGKNRFFGALTGAYKGAGLDEKFDPTKAGKAWKEGQKAGKEYYKQTKTSHFSERKNKENEALFEEAELMKKYRAIGGNAGAYRMFSDTGDPQQKKFREFLKGYGKFAFEQQEEEYTHDEADNKRQTELLAPMASIAEFHQEVERLRTVLSSTTDPAQRSQLMVDIATAEARRQDAVAKHERMMTYDTEYQNFHRTNIGVASSDINNFVAAVNNMQTSIDREAYNLRERRKTLDKQEAEVGQTRISGRLSDYYREILENYKRNHPDEK